MAQFGLVSPKTVYEVIQPQGGGDRTARDTARGLIVKLLSRDAACGAELATREAAGEWADQFLAPVLSGTPLYTGTGTADHLYTGTATINHGIVFVLGDPAGGEGSSVGCIWFGDEV